MSAPPPLPPKNRSSSVGQQASSQGVSEENAFSVSAAKALFEAAKRPEVQKAATVAAKNPAVRNAAMNSAKDKDNREQMFSFLSATKPSTAGSTASPGPPPPLPKKDFDKPAPPPHRGAPAKKEYVPSTVQFGYQDAPSAFNRGPTNTSSSAMPPPAPMPPAPAPAAPIKSAPQYNSIVNQLQSMHLNQPPQSGRPAAPPAQTFAAAPKPLRPPPPLTFGHPPLPKPASPTEPHAVVKYAFNGTQFDELTCNAGDTVLLKREVDHERIYGTNTSTGNHGMIPFSFLEVRVPLAPQQHQQYSNQQYGSHAPPANAVTALYDYLSNTPGDLQFYAGEHIVLLERVDADWLRGQTGGRSGIFPANFVTGDAIYSLSLNTVVSASHVLEVLYAAYDYESGVKDDLRLKAGERVEVLENLDGEWIKGRTDNNQYGLAPRSFLTSQQSPKKSPTGLAALGSALASINNVMMCIESHETNDPTHLYISKGDKVIVVKEVDEHWCLAKPEIFKTLPAGLIPRRKLA